MCFSEPAYVTLTAQQFADRVFVVYNALVRIADRRCGHSNAEDLATRAIENGLENLTRFHARRDGDDGMEFFAWLMGILNNACDDFIRRAAQHGETLLPTDSVLALCDRPDDTATTDYDRERDRREYVIAALERITLTGRQETCIRRALDGATQTEIAQQLGISQPAVREHLEAVYRKLSQARAAEDTDGDWRSWWDQVCTVYGPNYFRPFGCWKRRGNAEEIAAASKAFAIKDELPRQAAIQAARDAEKYDREFNTREDQLALEDAAGATAGEAQ